MKGIVAVVAATPVIAAGLAYAANYLAGRGRLVQDRQIVESHKIALDLIEQIIRIEGALKAAAGPPREDKLLDVYRYATDDFYNTVIALRAEAAVRSSRRQRDRAIAP